MFTRIFSTLEEILEQTPKRPLPQLQHSTRRHHMAEPDEHRKVSQKRELGELRDLEPEKDAKGGSARVKKDSEKRRPKHSGEIDFMNWE